MEVDRETSRLDFCNYCLIRDRGLTKYSLDQSPGLKSIFQVEELLFCYVCKKLAKNAEEFIQKVGNAQKMFEVFGVVDAPTLNTIKQQIQVQPHRYLSEQTLEPIQISPDDTEFCTEYFDSGNYKIYGYGGKVKETQFKVEIKLENMLQSNDGDGDHDFGDDELPDAGFDMKDDLSLLMIKQELVGEEVDLQLLEERVKKESRRRKKTNTKKIRKHERVEVKKEPRPSSKRYDTSYVETVYLSAAALARERAAQGSAAPYAGAPLQCAECLKGFTVRSSYDQHMAKHSPSHGEYECKICKIRKKSEYLLECHMKYHRVRYRCTVCNVTRVNRRTVRDHYSRCHDTETVHKCAQCAKIYKSARSLRAHTWYAHTNTHGARATCDHCQKTFATKSSLQTHVLLKHGQASPALRTHACGACGKRFLAPSLLRKHMLAHTDRRDYYCVECDKSFKSEQSLNHHLTTTTSHVTNKELRYACTQCEKRFPNRRDLENHLNKHHLHVKPHQCDKCDRAYVSKWSLQNHTRLTHEGYKLPRKYPCQMCDKVFDRNQILIAHIRTHTGERPYQCPHCSASFAQRNVLHTHTRLIHLKQTRNGRAKLTR